MADDFLPAMAKLIDRDRQLDHIVIETSGLALPQPLIDAFNWPQVRQRVTVDGVVTVVDARAVADGRFAEDEAAIAAARAADPAIDHDDPLAELFEDQLTAADLIVLNKCRSCRRAGAFGGRIGAGRALPTAGANLAGQRYAARRHSAWPAIGERGRSRQPQIAT